MYHIGKMCKRNVDDIIKRIGVLLVDSHPTFARIALRFLEQDQEIAVVGLLTTHHDLLQAVRQAHPNVVLMDLGMSDPSRFETISQLRQSTPDSHIIALTLFDAEGYREAALAAGADDFVVKDALHRDLLPAIHRVVNA